MVKFINALTGTEMWVHETRVEEYIKRGHKLAPPPPPPVPKKAQRKPKKEPVSK